MGNLNLARRFGILLSTILYFFSTRSATNNLWYLDEGMWADGDALLPFKEGVQDPQRTLRDWSFAEIRCSGIGIECRHVGTRRMMLGYPKNSTSTSHSRNKKVSKWGLCIALGAATGALGAALVAVILHFAVKYFTTSNDLKKPIIFNKKISLKMLAFLDKEDALEVADVIGEGGSGKVYRVTMETGQVVAIKRVSNILPDIEEQQNARPEDLNTIDPNAKQIKAELETLGFIRHRNLVQLWAYVYKRDSHLLIYEYMQMGSLHDAITRMGKGEMTLSWPQRHHILSDVAQGLEYLHNNSLRNSIVHRDLKPANILLDDDLGAKLADFGLAAILPDNATHVSTKNFAGTIGYIAPEYHQTQSYSQKTDIYSFGVVLVQMVTGRAPTDDFFISTGGPIGSWLQNCLQDGTGPKAIDSALQGTGYDAEILLAMKIACFCTHKDPLHRPTSTDVLKMLSQIRNPDPVPSGLLNNGIPLNQCIAMELNSNAFPLLHSAESQWPTGSEPFSSISSRSQNV